MGTIKRVIAWLQQRTKLAAGVVAGLIVGGLGSAAVLAAIPDANGVIHGCYRTSNGSFRIIDSATQTCAGNEASINWNQTGPQGPAGPTGPQGPQGPSGGGGGLVTNDLADANLHGAVFLAADLSNVDFTGASLSSAEIGYSTITGATFVGVDFEGAMIRNMDFEGHNLQNTNYLLANIFNNSFKNADLTGANFGYDGGVSMSDNDFQGANVSNALFGGIFSNLNFAGANFSNATIDRNPNFSSAGDVIEFQNSNFTNANFSGVQFATNPNMTILFKDSNFTGVDLSAANLSRVDWDNTTCPDGTNSNTNSDTCVGHLTP